MKGIVHFVVGVAAASFVPGVVSEAAGGDATLFVMGGVFGLLPDTLDFKVWRYLYAHQVEIAPDSECPDARRIAKELVNTVREVWSTGQPQNVKLNTIRRGANRWHQYHLRFDVAAQRLEVTCGPDVGTDRVPVDDDNGARGRATMRLPCAIGVDYLAVTTIDIFDGPTFRFTRQDERNRVEVGFLPWHRQWSHSLPVGAVMACVAWAVLGIRAAMVVMVAHSLHVLLDQLGYMGSNILFPFTKMRVAGMRWVHSGDVLPNFAAVWVSVMVLFWNLWVQGSTDSYSLSLMHYTAAWVMSPIVLCAWVVRRLG